VSKGDVDCGYFDFFQINAGSTRLEGRSEYPKTFRHPAPHSVSRSVLRVNEKRSYLQT